MGQTRRDEFDRPAIPKDLGAAIREFMEAHPDMGERSLSGFTTRACQRYLWFLRRQAHLADVLGGRADPETLEEDEAPRRP